MAPANGKDFQMTQRHHVNVDGLTIDVSHVNDDEKESIWRMLYNKQFTIIIVVSEIMFLILFGNFAEYDLDAGVSQEARTFANNSLVKYYAMFQDVNVMIFIGFGFLMTFLKKYSYSAVGFNFLLAAYSIQWSLLMRGFLEMLPTDERREELHQSVGGSRMFLEITQLVNADFCAGAVLISMGALLGRISAPQYLVMAFFEVVFYAFNEYINYNLLKVADIGGSTIIHTFGAYFGLACSRILYSEKCENNIKEKASYFDDMFAMIGTLFLWMYWPSFNAVLGETESGESAHRTVINTYLSLAACCVITFAMSSLVNDDHKLDMAHIQNATLAGGVAVGASANLLLTPVGALLVGSIAGSISVLGYRFLTPLLRSRKVHDTCGVHNLHGMPGVIGGIVGIVVASIASTEAYGKTLYDFYPARTPHNGVLGRGAALQAGYQVAGLACTIAFALVGGVCTGLIMKLPCWIKLDARDFFDDSHFWEVPIDECRSPRRRHSISVNEAA